MTAKERGKIPFKQKSIGQALTIAGGGWGGLQPTSFMVHPVTFDDNKCPGKNSAYVVAQKRSMHISDTVCYRARNTWAEFEENAAGEPLRQS
jgi:hypothetical protein